MTDSTLMFILQNNTIILTVYELHIHLVLPLPFKGTKAFEMPNQFKRINADENSLSRTSSLWVDMELSLLGTIIKRRYSDTLTNALCGIISWFSAQLIYKRLRIVHIYKIYILQLAKDFAQLNWYYPKSLLHQLLFELTSNMSFVRTPCFYLALLFARVAFRHLWILRATQQTKTVPERG